MHKQLQRLPRKKKFNYFLISRSPFQKQTRLQRVIQNSQLKLQVHNVNVSYTSLGSPPGTAAQANQASPRYEHHTLSQSFPTKTTDGSKLNFRLDWNADAWLPVVD